MSDTERLTRACAVAFGAGRMQEHLRFVLDYLGRREIELNSRIEDAEENVAFLMEHNGSRQIAELETKCAALQAELADARGERDAYMTSYDAVCKARDAVQTDSEIVRLAREWGLAIQNLEQARKKKDDAEKKKGGVSTLKANEAYTAAQTALKTHLALKAALKLTEEPAISKS